MNKRKIGLEYEEKAIDFLEKNNYTILHKNFFYEKCEVDIIALNQQGTLIFIEVKYRKVKNPHFNPYESVGKKKQEKIVSAANGFLLQNQKYQDRFSRYDVILILFYVWLKQEKIIHLENAFYDESRSGKI